MVGVYSTTTLSHEQLLEIATLQYEYSCFSRIFKSIFVILMFFLNVSDSESNGSVMIQAQFKTHRARERALVINYAIFEMRTNSTNELHRINAAERGN